MQVKHLTFALFAALLISVSQLSAGEGAGNGPKKGNHANIEGRLHQRQVRIGKRIDRLNACVAKHPNCPANIQADVTKLTGDLDTQKNNVGTWISMIQKKDKAGAKAQHQIVKAECQVIKADRATLRTDRQAYRAERQAAKGAGEGAGQGAAAGGKRHGNKQK